MSKLDRGWIAKQFEFQNLSKEYRFTTQYLSTTGTWTTSSAIVTGIPTTSGLDSNYLVSGTGIQNDTYILSVDSGTQVTLSQTPSSAGTATTLNFGKTKYSLPSDYDRQIDRTHYDKSKRVGERACPFNSLYWDFFARNEKKLRGNPRLGITYKNLDHMKELDEVRAQAKKHLEQIEEL